jgi:hypothetical protein
LDHGTYRKGVGRRVNREGRKIRVNQLSCNLGRVGSIKRRGVDRSTRSSGRRGKRGRGIGYRNLRGCG